jgi:cyclic nucleotide gated channel
MFFKAHIATGFCTAYVDPVSKVLGKNKLTADPNKIVKRYISTNLAALPVPQI